MKQPNNLIFKIVTISLACFAAISALWIDYKMAVGEPIVKNIAAVLGVIFLVGATVNAARIQHKIHSGEQFEPAALKIYAWAYAIENLVGSAFLWPMWRELSVWYLMTPICYVAANILITKRFLKGPAKNTFLYLPAAALTAFAGLLCLQLSLR